MTLTLSEAQQAAYETINFAFTATRGGTNVSYRSFITAIYDDATSQIIYDTGLEAATVTSPIGGTFGSAGVADAAAVGQGGFTVASDSDPDVSLIHASNRILSVAGSNNTIRSGTGALWQFTTPLALDSEKVLKSLTFSVQTTGVNRPNTAYFFAATAAVPEPSSVALLIALPTLALRRRRRRAATA